MSPSRRHVLQVTGAAVMGGLAGCADSLTATETPTPYPSVDPVANPWPSARHDARNTVATASPGPTSRPTEYWYTADGLGETPVLTDTSLYTFDGTLHALAIADGSVRWQQTLERNARNISGPSPTVHDGVVYVGTHAGRLAAFDTADGTHRWSTTFTLDEPANNTPYRADVSAPPLVADDQVVVVTSNRVVAVSTSDGSVNWARDETLTTETVAIANGRLFLVRDVEPVKGMAQLVAVAADDGTDLWTVAFEDSPSAPVVHDGTVYIATTYNRNRYDQPGLFALSAADGSVEWTFGSADPTPPTPTRSRGYRVGRSHPPAVNSSMVAFAFGDSLVALAPTTGEERWRYDLPGLAAWPPRLADDTVFVGWEEGIGAVAAAGGTERWQYEFEGRARGPAPIVAGEAMYVPTKRGLLALRARDKNHR